MAAIFEDLNVLEAPQMSCIPVSQWLSLATSSQPQSLFSHQHLAGAVLTLPWPGSSDLEQKPCAKIVEPGLILALGHSGD